MRPATAAKMHRSSAARASGTCESAARRHSMPTVPESEVTPSPGASPVEINKPIWAVDLGDEIRALSTFDLWMGLSRGELSTEVRVWRMGRECWTAAREVPELACALSPESAARATADEEHAERVTLGYSSRREPEAATASEVAPLESPAPAPAVFDAAALEAWMAEPIASPAPPVREPRRLVRARKIRRHLAVAAASTAAIVLLAIGLGAPRGDVAHASEKRPAALTPDTARPVEPVTDLAAGGRVPAPRARRVSPSHAGQERRR